MSRGIMSDINELPELPDDAESLPELPGDAELLDLPEEAEVVPPPKKRSRIEDLPELEPVPVAEEPAKPEPKPAPPVEKKPAAAKPAPPVEKKPAAPAPPVAKEPVKEPVTEPAPAAAATPEPQPAEPKPAEPEPQAAADPAPAVEELPMEEVPASEATAGAAAAGAVGAAAGAAADGQDPGQKRELDQAPILLRKAAVIVAIGSIVPWASAGKVDLVMNFPGKLILLLAAWIFHQSHVLKYQGKAVGFVQALGKKNLYPVWALAGVVAAVGLAPIFEGGFYFSNFSEKLILLLATFTFTHIYDYEHGGKFNPIFPLMFLAPAVGGIGGIISSGGHVLEMLGAITVTAGALFACYTMGVALKQAKIEGDAKRAAHREARKAERASSRPAQAAGPKPAAQKPAGQKKASGTAKKPVKPVVRRSRRT